MITHMFTHVITPPHVHTHPCTRTFTTMQASLQHGTWLAPAPLKSDHKHLTHSHSRSPLLHILQDGLCLRVSLQSRVKQWFDVLTCCVGLSCVATLLLMCTSIPVLCITGGGTQGPMHPRQALYQPSHTHSPTFMQKECILHIHKCIQEETPR